MGDSEAASTQYTNGNGHKLSADEIRAQHAADSRPKAPKSFQIGKVTTGIAELKGYLEQLNGNKETIEQALPAILVTWAHERLPAEQLDYGGVITREALDKFDMQGSLMLLKLAKEFGAEVDPAAYGEQLKYAFASGLEHAPGQNMLQIESLMAEIGVGKPEHYGYKSPKKTKEQIG